MALFGKPCACAANGIAAQATTISNRFISNSSGMFCGMRRTRISFGVVVIVAEKR
ncbi:MAG: hypothetical protein ACO1PN_16320 [Betaproteobacteria bacterium]